MRKYEQDPTWEEWERDMIDDYDTSRRYDNGNIPTWLSLGSWLYPAKENNAYGGDKQSHVVYHVCKKNYERNYNRDSKGNKLYAVGKAHSPIASIEIGCRLCEEKVPDSFKMIMMLERL